MFVDFVGYLLTIDPESRPTAAQALHHPWMQYAASLSDADIRYPKSSESKTSKA
jgi:serine/threonine protein kinase